MAEYKNAQGSQAGIGKEKKVTIAEAMVLLAEEVKRLGQKLDEVHRNVSTPPLTNTKYSGQIVAYPITPAQSQTARGNEESPGRSLAFSESVVSSLAPVPTSYRDLVDNVLNSKFGIRIEPLADTPAFRFVVVVPSSYSTISEEYKKMYKEDLRPKVISYSDGAIGVRDWVEKVFNSFNQDTRTQIVMDRVDR